MCQNVVLAAGAPLAKLYTTSWVAKYVPDPQLDFGEREGAGKGGEVKGYGRRGREGQGREGRA